MTDTAVYDQQPTDISNSLQISQNRPNSVNLQSHKWYMLWLQTYSKKFLIYAKNLPIVINAFT